MPILTSIANARDLGGIRLPDGGILRSGLLLRGGALYTASEEDLQELSGHYHVAKVFDFRTSREIKMAPDLDIAGAQNIWMPAFDENSQSYVTRNLPHEAYSDLGNYLTAHACEPFVQELAAALYMDMVTSEFTQIQYAGFLQNILATTEGAVYWHCSQGKDRTGLAAAFIIAALGGDRKAILYDYCLSEEFYRDELARYIGRVETEAEKAVLRTYMSVNPAAFERALDWIDDTFGSMDNFLRGPLCLSGRDIGELRSRYVIRP